MVIRRPTLKSVPRGEAQRRHDVRMTQDAIIGSFVRRRPARGEQVLATGTPESCHLQRTACRHVEPKWASDLSQQTCQSQVPRHKLFELILNDGTG